jgi:nitrite reductase/ring-hydroxylating ferredoxin subunit
MGFFKRLFGICATPPPADTGCWRFADGVVEVELARTPELAANGGAVRLEGGELPTRVLVLRGDDGALHALENKCDHAGRRLDPLAGSGQVECCSIGKSRYDYDGLLHGGMAKQAIRAFPLAEADGVARITLG